MHTLKPNSNSFQGTIPSLFVRTQPAAAILGSTVQIMLLARYQDAHKFQDFDAADTLHRYQLFWQAYIMDTDLTIRLRKAPAITTASLIDLPEPSSKDGRDELAFDDGLTLNFLRARVGLAKIQSKVYLLLHSVESSRQFSPSQIHTNMIALDRELQAWKASVPELIRPQMPIATRDAARLTCLTILHYTYFQLVIAIHSIIFIGVSEQNIQEQRRSAIPSIALCIGAARASIYLLDYQHCSYPFTV